MVGEKRKWDACDRPSTTPARRPMFQAIRRARDNSGARLKAGGGGCIVMLCPDTGLNFL